MEDLKLTLKQQIIESLNLQGMTPADIDDNAPLFGDGLGLSILIKLVIVLALKGVESIVEDRIKKKPKLQTLDSPVKTFFDFGRASAAG